MVAITTDVSVCTVMVRLETAPGDFDAVAAVVRAHAGLFDTRDGFLGRAMHLADDRTEIVHYLRWRSLADHEACMADPDVQREGGGHAGADRVGQGAHERAHLRGGQRLQRRLSLTRSGFRRSAARG